MGLDRQTFVTLSGLIRNRVSTGQWTFRPHARTLQKPLNQLNKQQLTFCYLNKKKNMEESSIKIFQTENGKTEIQAVVQSETVWLSQKQIADLFETDSDTI
jgi:hypothetical protein